MQVLEIHKVAYCFSCIKKEKKLSTPYPTTHYSYFGKRKPTTLQQERENVKTNLKEVEGKTCFKHLQNYLKEFIYSLL